MMHSVNPLRQRRFLTAVLDIFCGRSFDDTDDRDRLIGFAASLATVIILSLLFVWRKEIFFGISACLS